MSRRAVIKASVSWHKKVLWLGFAALLVWGLSGILHPLMSWTGPKAKAFYPPRVEIAPTHLDAVPDILLQREIERAQAVKVVPGERGVMLQVTEAPDQARRYFDLKTGFERPDYDRQYALWLASYYAGVSKDLVRDVSFKTEFDAEYPWVNRLLPVYRVSLATPDNQVLFIYTETASLAGITNDWKTALQELFRALHTWSWLESFEFARVLLIALLVLCLFAMAATGMVLLWVLKQRKMPMARKLHRSLAYIVVLPLLLYSTSGFYHLLQSAYGENLRGLHWGEQLDLSEERLRSFAGLSMAENYQGGTLASASLIESPESELLYRLAQPRGKPGQSVSREVRYRGEPMESSAFFIDVSNGEISDASDRELAAHYAAQHLGIEALKPRQTQLITHFGPHYDFRNKRLPVWQVDFDTDAGDKLFIDPSNGMLVDRLVDHQRYEGYSFSFLHKFNFLTPLMGRFPRDVLVVVVLSLALVLSILGVLVHLRRRP